MMDGRLRSARHRPTKVIAPSIAFICGVNWCRFVVGVLSTIVVLSWSPLPLMQHAIESRRRFWCGWGITELVLLATVVTSFLRVSEVKNAT